MMSVTTAERPPHLLSEPPSSPSNSPSNSPFSLPHSQSSALSQSSEMSDTADVAMATSLTSPPLGQNHDREAVDMEFDPAFPTRGSVVDDARDSYGASVAMEGNVVETVRHREATPPHTTPPTTTTNNHTSHEHNSPGTRPDEAISRGLQSEPAQAHPAPASAEAEARVSDTPPPDASSPSDTPPSPQLAAQQEDQQPIDEENEDSSSAEDEMNQFWEETHEDLSSPTEDELKGIEKGKEISALDHQHWQDLTFKDLDDPEHRPGVYGRIAWEINRFNGTKVHPNKERVLSSRKIRIGGYDWMLKLFPRGDDTDYISLYIENRTILELVESGRIESPKSGLQRNTSPLADDVNSKRYLQTPIPLLNRTPIPKRRSVAAQISIVMYNPSEPRVYTYQQAQHRFSPGMPDWGWTRFHDRYEMQTRQPGQRQAMLRDDKLAFTAYIRIVKDDTDCLWEHPPKDHLWDSFSITGVTGLSTTGVWKPGGNLIAAVSSWLLLKPVRQLLYDAQAPDSFNEGYARPKPILLALQRILYGLRCNARSGPTPPVSLDLIHRALRWYNISTDIRNLDPVRILEILRTKLQEELGTTKFSNHLGRIFGSQKKNVLQQPSYRISPEQTESIRDAIANNAMKILNVNESPIVLQLEIQRQEFDSKQRTWQKLVKKIKLDEQISYLKSNYILFGLIVHKGHWQSGEYYSILRPGGRGSKWFQFLENNEVHCLTRKQALVDHDSRSLQGLEIQQTPVAQVVFYVREDMAANVFDTSDDEEWKVSANVETPLGQKLESLEPDNLGIEKAQEKLQDSDLNPQRIRVLESKIFNKHEGPGFVDLFGGHSPYGGVHSMEIRPTWGPEDIRSHLSRIIPGVKDPNRFEYFFSWATGSHRISQCKSKDDQSETRNSNGKYICNAVQTTVDAIPVLWVCIVPEGDLREEVKEANTSNADTSGDIPMIDVDADVQMSGTQDVQPQANHQPNPTTAQQQPSNVAAKNILVKHFDPQTQKLKAVGSYVVQVNKPVYETLLGITRWPEATSFKVYYEYRTGEEYASEISNIHPNSGKVFEDCGIGCDIAILIVQKTLSDDEKDALLREAKFADPASYIKHSYFSANFSKESCGSYSLHYFGQEQYDGAVKHGVPHGMGTKIYSTGEIYEGNFCLGERHGLGKMTSKNGDTYMGNWVHGKRNGQGESLEASTGNHYSGNWEDDEQCGKGTTNWENQAKYKHPCIICYDADGNWAFVPCGHQCACEDCAKRMPFCPKCRQNFEKVYRIYPN